MQDKTIVGTVKDVAKEYLERYKNENLHANKWLYILTLIGYSLCIIDIIKEYVYTEFSFKVK